MESDEHSLYSHGDSKTTNPAGCKGPTWPGDRPAANQYRATVLGIALTLGVGGEGPDPWRGLGYKGLFGPHGVAGGWWRSDVVALEQRVDHRWCTVQRHDAIETEDGG